MLMLRCSWPIGAIQTPGFSRKGLVHKTLSFMDAPPALQCHAFDDEVCPPLDHPGSARLNDHQVEFNTQCSSQWDSLVHFNHQPTGSAYNGAKPTVKDLEQPFGTSDAGMKFPTLNRTKASLIIDRSVPD